MLGGVPELQKMGEIPKPEAHRLPHSNTMGEWYYQTSLLPKKDRARVRSKTFPGVARAMAMQWVPWLLGKNRQRSIFDYMEWESWIRI